MVNSKQEVMESFKSFVAGWVAGCAGLIVSQPIDTIKVREQAMSESIMSAIKTILRHEGFIGLYRGVLAPLIIIGPSNAVFFCIYSESMRLLDRYTKSHQDILVKDWIGRVTLAGAVAGFAQVIVTCPAELIKVVVQTRNWKDTHATTPYGIWKESGFRGFYRGLVPMLFRDVPTSSVYILVYESLAPKGDEGTILQQILAGGLAGMCSWFGVTPFDVVKSRIQSDNPNNPQYKGMIDCFQKLYKEGGIRIFHRGFLLLMFRAFPTNAVMFLTYEKCLKLFHANPEYRK